MVERTHDRVTRHTDPVRNEAIHRCTERRIAFYKERPDLIRRRLGQLEREWDVERYLEVGSASLSLTGLLLAITKDRRWLVVPLAVQGFFLQHAIQGWCPPLPVLRALGVRTQKEIDAEKHALLEIERVALLSVSIAEVIVG